MEYYKRYTILTVLFLVMVSCAYADTFNALNDPTVFTNLPASDVITANTLRFLNPVVGSCSDPAGTFCSDSNYVSPFGGGTGGIQIYDKTPGLDLKGLLIQATFKASDVTDSFSWSGSIGSYDFTGAPITKSSLTAVGGRAIGNSSTSALTNVYNSGYAAYIYLNLANPANQGTVTGFPGIPTPPPGQLNVGEAVSIPYSFVNLPANVIFNVYGVSPCSSGSSSLCVDVTGTNPNSSTFGIGSGHTTGGGGGGAVPEPASLFLLTTGLTGFALRLRRPLK